MLRVRDADGSAAEIPLSSVRRVPHLYDANLVFEVLQTIRIPLAQLAASSPELNLLALASLEMSMGMPGHETGSIVVTDIELAR